MFPHWWLFTTCTRPELYESEVLPFRHSLMGPLVTAIWPKRREEQAVLYSTLQHIVHVSKLPYLLLRGLEYTTAATANCSETISSSWTVLGPALWLLSWPLPGAYIDPAKPAREHATRSRHLLLLVTYQTCRDFYVVFGHTVSYMTAHSSMVRCTNRDSSSSHARRQEKRPGYWRERREISHTL